MATSPFPPPPRAHHPSFQIHPTDIELGKVLYNRVCSSSGRSRPSPLIIYEADVYAADPDDLTQRFEPAVDEHGETAWYFLTQQVLKHPKGKRMKRCVDSGVWHGEGKSISIVVAGLGSVRRNFFTFKRKGPDGKLERTDWLMRQYQLEDGNEQNLVLCKIYSQGKVQRSPRHRPSSSVVAPNNNGTQASRAVEAVAAAAKKLQQKIEEMMLGKIETATISEIAAFDAAKASLPAVENTIRMSNMRVERVKDMLKASGVSLPRIVEAGMASAKATASAMAVTKAPDLIAALQVAMESANATVIWAMAIEKENKVAVLMVAEAAAEAAAKAALVVVQAAKEQAAKLKGREALNMLVAAVAAAVEAGNTVEATARAIAALGILRRSHEQFVKVMETETEAAALGSEDVLAAATTVAMATAAESYRDGDGDGDNGIALTAVAPETDIVASATLSTSEATAAGECGLDTDSSFESFMQVGSSTGGPSDSWPDTGCSIQPSMPNIQGLQVVPPLECPSPTNGLGHFSPEHTPQHLTTDRPCYLSPPAVLHDLRGAGGPSYSQMEGTSIQPSMLPHHVLQTAEPPAAAPTPEEGDILDMLDCWFNQDISCLGEFGQPNFVP